MNVKITVIVDNKAEKPFRQEHGLSLWIEKDGFSILFDTGQSEAFGTNCSILGIEPKKADAVVLSHGHYDHGKNLAMALSQGDAALYMHPEALITRYSCNPDQPVRSIGLTDENSKAVSDYTTGKVHRCDKVTKIVHGIFLTGSVPRITSFENTGGHFYLTQDSTTPDPVNDDMSLWINTPKGLVVVCGCCHSGLVNTLSYIKSLTNTKVHTLIGGFHMLRANDMRLEKSLEYLDNFAPQQIIPLHCTGERFESLLKNRFGKNIVEGSAGLHVNV